MSIKRRSGKTPTGKSYSAFRDNRGKTIVKHTKIVEYSRGQDSFPQHQERAKITRNGKVSRVVLTQRGKSCFLT